MQIHLFYSTEADLTARNQLADRIAHSRKLGFILSHDIALSHITVMKITGAGFDCPPRLRNSLQRVGKQILIIRLKFHTAVFCQLKDGWEM